MSIARRGRAVSAVAFLLAGGIGIISSTQTWLTVTRADAGEAIAVAGADALPLLAPLSLAVLALGAALAIAGRVLRHVLAALALLGAVALGWWSAQVVFAAPVSAVSAAVTEATGLAGSDAVDALIADIAVTFWPVLALIGWIVLAAAAVYALITASRWKAGGRRFRTDAAAHGPSEGPVDAIDSWDDLSRGTDPTR